MPSEPVAAPGGPRAQGLAYCGAPWGRRVVVRDPQGKIKPRDQYIKGLDRKCLEWDMDFLQTMANFVCRLRKGERAQELIEEFRAKHRDWQGKSFLACYDRDGKMHSPDHTASKNRARKWAKTFVRLQHKGELPAPFSMPGITNPVDRGVARQSLRLDRPSQLHDTAEAETQGPDGRRPGPLQLGKIRLGTLVERNGRRPYTCGREGAGCRVAQGRDHPPGSRLRSPDGASTPSL